MSMFLSSGPGTGLEPRRQEVTLNAYAALTKGDLVAVSADIDTNGRFYSTRAPIAAGDAVYALSVGMFVVALEDIAASKSGRFLVSGIVEVEVEGTADIAAGHPLTAVASQSYLILATTANNKVIGYALEAQAADEAVIITVMFDGINGFGTVVTT